MLKIFCCAAFAGALLLTSCSDGPEPVSMDTFNTRSVVFPNGKTVRAEVMMRNADLLRGMMFRDSIAPDRGMLFVYRQPGNYSFWMYQVRIPLDMIWIDADRRVVDIVPNVPPCPSKSAKECPHFGGTKPAKYVLQVGAGNATRLGVKVGDPLDF